MTATIAPYPTTCPHGTEQQLSHAAPNGVWMAYTDGCWTTSREMSLRAIFHLDDTAFRSITLQDYLWAWSDALAEATRRWSADRKREEDEANYLRDWDEALVLNAGDELYDEAANENYWFDHDARANAAQQSWQDEEVARIQGGKSGVEYERCGCLINSADAHRGSCPEYLGEVPWTDRVGD